jgi:hypothetical protein
LAIFPQALYSNLFSCGASGSLCFGDEVVETLQATRPTDPWSLDGRADRGKPKIQPNSYFGGGIKGGQDALRSQQSGRQRIARNLAKRTAGLIRPELAHPLHFPKRCPGSPHRIGD